MYWAPARLAAGWASSSRRRACGERVLARGATLAAIRAEGLRLIEAGETKAVKVAASDKPGDLTADEFPDLLIVAVKSQGLRDAVLAAKAADRSKHHRANGDERRAVVVFQRSDRPLPAPRWRASTRPVRLPPVSRQPT